jgi:hypothetical protein
LCFKIIIGIDFQEGGRGAVAVAQKLIVTTHRDRVRHRHVQAQARRAQHHASRVGEDRQAERRVRGDHHREPGEQQRVAVAHALASPLGERGGEHDLRVMMMVAVCVASGRTSTKSFAY